eukprot:TRINITY_DN1999_c0_g1_i2.p1 TRINITY_DN1999_c0_g1~~TRINITY_DN1999_c0_g1_i2.p1  ORF type:complete len:305 (-),score=70.71 TRINITY_DN1999_c0_g1_i2:189-1103(-)
MYLKEMIRPLWGEVVNIQTDGDYKIDNRQRQQRQQHELISNNGKLVSSIKGDVSITHNSKDHLVIGSTHVRNDSSNNNSDIDVDDDDKSIWGSSLSNDYMSHIKDKSADRIERLIQSAKEMIDFKVNKIIDVRAGIRAVTPDSFPLVGKIVDEEKTLFNHFPHIIHGKKVKNSELPTKGENLYILSALGSRGFVVSPFVSNLLAEYITSSPEEQNKNTTLDEFHTGRLLQTWAVKSHSMRGKEYFNNLSIIKKKKEMKYKVTRLDIHDNKFDVRSFTTKEAAEAFCEEMTNRQHHQWYYVERVE